MCPQLYNPGNPKLLYANIPFVPTPSVLDTNIGLSL